MLRAWLKKHWLPLLALAAFLYLAIGATAPFFHYKTIPDKTKEQFSAERFYQDGPGVDRAMILETNESAWEERLRFMNLAQERIILSTFDFRDGESPRDLLSVMLHKAEEGVQVKILVDGFSGLVRMEGSEIFYALSSHPNVEIKIYNPMNLALPWKTQGRMHDKYVIVDDYGYILGGRNTFDYFIGSYPTDSRSHDREVLVYNTAHGAKNSGDSSLGQVLDYFEGVWNLDCCRLFHDDPGLADKRKVREAVETLHQRYESLAAAQPELLDPAAEAGATDADAEPAAAGQDSADGRPEANGGARPGRQDNADGALGTTGGTRPDGQDNADGAPGTTGGAHPDGQDNAAGALGTTGGARPDGQDNADGAPGTTDGAHPGRQDSAAGAPGTTGGARPGRQDSAIGASGPTGGALSPDRAARRDRVLSYYNANTHEAGKITLVSNPTGIYGKEPLVFFTLTELMKSAKEDVDIHTPYAVFNAYMYDTMAEVNRHIPVDMMINSVENGDNFFASSDYLRHRREMAATGLTIYEYDGGMSYHGKSVVIDHELAAVGSYNFDLRSTYMDTELMLVIQSEGLTRELEQYMASYERDCRKLLPDGSYQIPDHITVADVPLWKRAAWAVVGFVMQPVRFLI